MSLEELIDDVLKSYLKNDKRREQAVTEILRVWQDFLWY